MKAFLHITKNFILWVTVIGLMVASVAIVFIATLILVVSYLWEPVWVNSWAVLCLAFLNGGNILFVGMTALVAFDRTMLNSADSFWPQGPAYMVLGAGLLISALSAGAIVLDPALLDIFEPWLFPLAATNILLAVSAALAVAVSPSIAVPNRRLLLPLCFAHIIAVVYAIAATVLMTSIDKPANELRFSDYIAALIPTLWIELTAVSSAVVFSNWHKTGTVFMLSGAVVTAIALAGACFYATTANSGTWYPVALATIPLLLFIVILARRYWIQR